MADLATLLAMQQEMGRGQQPLPSAPSSLAQILAGLPDVVRQSILTAPSFAEGSYTRPDMPKMQSQGLDLLRNERANENFNQILNQQGSNWWDRILNWNLNGAPTPQQSI